jgi:hypothetical protein
MSDPIDAAIGAVESTVNMIGVDVRISSTGRQFTVGVPEDMTEAELLEMLGWLVTVLAGTLKANRERGKTRILVPRGSVQ